MKKIISIFILVLMFWILYVAVVNHAGEKTWVGFYPLIDADDTYTTYEEFTK